MTDLDTFRQALRAGDLALAREPDVPLIIRDGRRLRTRRRLRYVAAGALSVTVIAATAFTVYGGGSEPAPVLPAEPRVTATVSPPTPAPRPAPALLVKGGVVRTGLAAGDGGERVLFFTVLPIEKAKVTVALNAGQVGPDKLLRSDARISDARGYDSRPGFHQIGYGDTLPAYGWFVGPAARIIGVTGGRSVDARIARWSADPAVRIFWFDPADVAPGVRLQGITAVDADGKRL